MVYIAVINQTVCQAVVQDKILGYTVIRIAQLLPEAIKATQTIELCPIKQFSIEITRGRVAINCTRILAPFSDGSDIGGDEHSSFYQPCRGTLDNIPVELMRLRDETEVNSWIDSFTPIDTTAPDSITEYAKATPHN